MQTVILYSCLSFTGIQKFRYGFVKAALFGAIIGGFKMDDEVFSIDLLIRGLLRDFMC